VTELSSYQFQIVGFNNGKVIKFELTPTVSCSKKGVSNCNYYPSQKLLRWNINGNKQKN